MTPSEKEAWAAGIQSELVGNILSFWMRHVIDHGNGGFYGAVTPQLVVQERAARASVINSRILWTYSAAAQFGKGPYRAMADCAYNYLAEKFWDSENEGVYWMLDYLGNPTSDRKQIYAQAFAIYGLAEYFRATANPDSLRLARQLYYLIEDKSRDRTHRGYLEACSRTWGALDDLRLSEKDLNAPKSMNTHLHILEAYTNLLRVWRDPGLLTNQAELLDLTMERIIDTRTSHFNLFFDREWRSLSGHVSFGHDIEGSWLLCDAAEVVNDPTLLGRARSIGLRLAEAVYQQGLDQDGSLFYEADADGALVDPNKHWWAQAEAVVGFYNAYQLSGDERFLRQSYRIWQYVEEKVVDRLHGEWHAKLKPDGTPWKEDEDPDACLVGPWKCPYHNSRACFEMLRRLSE
jgi:mannobiose 2-epimerase